MSIDLFLAFCAYAVATSISPGPANLLVFASGAKHGPFKTLPVVLGIASGLGVMVLAAGFGMLEFLGKNAVLLTTLKVIGALYIAYLAWSIYRSRNGIGPNDVNHNQKLLTYFNGLTLPLLNPKAWMMAFGAVTSYASPSSASGLSGIVAIVFAIINAPCMMLWAALGGSISKLLKDPRHEFIFKLAMCGLLLLSMVPIAKELLQEAL